MALIESIMAAVGLVPKSEEKYPIKALLASAMALKPTGYDEAVSKALAYYHGTAQSYALRSLAAAFPRSYSKMSPRGIATVRRIVKAKSRVFAELGDMDLMRAGEEVDEAGGVTWDSVLDEGQVHAKLLEANRLATLLRLAFVRVRWDEGWKRVELELWSPDRVFVTPHPDDRDPARGLVVALEIEPVTVGDKQKRRFQVWTCAKGLDGTPEPVRIVREDGVVLASSPNPYTDEAREPIVPVVCLNAGMLDGATWQLPPQDLINSAEVIDADLTSDGFARRFAGWPQWLLQTTDTSPDAPPEQMVFGPDALIKVPRGWTMTSQPQALDIVGNASATQSYINLVSAGEAMPRGTAIGDAREVPSGVALTLDRAPLDEERQDQVEAFRFAVLRLLDVIRLVRNVHVMPAQRFLNVRPRWIPGGVKPPTDPAAQRDLDAKEVDLGIASPVTILMRDRGLSREEATAEAALIAAENAAKVSGMLNDAGGQVFDAPSSDATDPTPDATA